MKRIFLTVFGFAAAGFAQDMVSVRAGLIQHIEGAVQLDGKAVALPSREKMFSQFPEVKKGSVLSTGEGRAEILLSPGVTLRLGEDAALKMIDSDLADTKVEINKGVAVVEVLEILKDNLVTVTVGQSSIQFRRAGTYKIHASEKPELMVYDGQAEITLAGQTKVAKKGNAVSLENVTVARKFDTEKGDALLRWSMRRSGYMAMANVSAASAARSTGAFSDAGRRGFGGWYWNPYYSMYTYLPYYGMMCFNYSSTCYYSPGRVQQAFYIPPVYSNPGGGSQADMNNGTSYGYNQNLGYTVASGDRSYSGISSGASVSAGAPAAAAPVADSGGGRSGGDSGGRGGQGGGRAQ
jgi:FecR protein